MTTAGDPPESPPTATGPVTAAAVAEPSPPASRTVSVATVPPAARPFVFAGTGSAYFRIWIVNVLLTVVTVGFYSPWAKVRRLRYFYGNTLFDGSPFEFHGAPFALFKGRVIGLLLLVAYSQSPKVSLSFWFVVVGALLALMPWLLWESFHFRLANSSYRGVRFAFDGGLGEAYLTFVPLLLMVLGPAAVLVIARGDVARAATEGGGLRALASYYVATGIVLLLSPWFYGRLRAYQHGRARLGSTAFAFDGHPRSLYLIALKTIGFGCMLAFFGILAGLAVGGMTWMAARRIAPASTTMASTIAGGAVFYLLLISAWAFNRAMIQNFVWSHTTLGGRRFVSRVGRTAMWWIEFVNLVLTLLTLGFFWPFAVVRSARYRIERLAWDGDGGSLVVAAHDGRVGAAGEETADLFGLDIAL